MGYTGKQGLIPVKQHITLFLKRAIPGWLFFNPNSRQVGNGHFLNKPVLSNKYDK